MRVAVVSHTYMVQANRGKLEALARFPGLDVLAVTPRKWVSRDIGRRFHAEASATGPLGVISLPAWSLGSGSLVTYAPGAIRRVFQRFRPDLVHLEEEPWSLAALELSLICGWLEMPMTFFTWENTERRLPLPFRLIQKRVLRRASGGVAGNTDAKERLLRLGFKKPMTVVAQLGVDMSAFQSVASDSKGQDFVVGYVGRLVPQKGIDVLVEAVARLSSDTRLMLVGTGPYKDRILRSVRERGVEGRFELHEGVAHHEVPRYLQRMSALVLPSLTTPTWKEQFGHVLIEAMSCGVPVVGSNSGAIPEVIGEAGLVVPEGNAAALANALRSLSSSTELQADLATRGRARVLAEYNNDSVARRLAAFWETVLRRGT